MLGLRLDRVLDFVTGLGFFLGALWLGLCVLTIALLVLTYTRWGQSRPIRKCFLLSLLAHFWLACFSTTVQPLGPTQPVLGPEDATVQVATIEGLSGPAGPNPAQGAEAELVDGGSLADQPWERLADDRTAAPVFAEPTRAQARPTAPAERKTASTGELPAQPSTAHLPLAAAPRSEPPPPETERIAATAAQPPAERINVPAAERRTAQAPMVPVGPRPARAAPREVPAVAPNVKATRELPSALLEQSHEPPRMSITPAMVEPAGPVGPLAAEPDRNAPPRDRPAAIAPLRKTESSSAVAAPDPAYAGQSSGETSSGRMWTPSLAAVATRQNLTTVAEPQAVAALVSPGLAPRRDASKHAVPEPYRLRVAPDRAQLAERHGATGQTEAAVKAALRWLTAAQSADGRWDALKYGSGRETKTDGHARDGAGTQADTAITGLALLAFLASGHTHREGPYAENVYRGLRFLLENQAADGNLGGRATTFEFMYCHGISTFALSEAWGMSGDDALREPLRRALAYTIAAQDPNTGGWRYRPGDPGDTSQLGWQFMALKSADLAGLPMPENARNGIIKFLGSVSAGQQGGLASYRPQERYTRTMTAEAIACWQLLGMRRDHPAGREAGDYLLTQLPGQGEPNVYYWYYATLTMYQLGGIHWTRWNDALRSTLVSSQRTDGALAGSWDPDSVWGGYGGRIFSTSLSTLCLEIYYRFLPLYREAAIEDQAR
jgi:hypothetical protein